MVLVIVGLPLTPSPLVILILVPAVSVRVVQVLVAVRATMPLVARFSTARRSALRARVNVPAVVIGLVPLDVTVIPDAGCVSPMLVTVPDPDPLAASIQSVPVGVDDSTWPDVPGSLLLS